MHEGHRKRIMKRLAAAGGLQDHELLEILLFNAIPRKNTNDLAHRLLTSFHSFGGVLRATPDQLMQVEGVGPAVAAYLSVVGQVYLRADREELQSKYINLSDMSAHLLERYRGRPQEVIEVFCMDKSGRILFSSEYSSGMEERAELPAGELSRIIAFHCPFGILMAHNHPNAHPSPSSSDDCFTARALLECSCSGVALYDHIIVGKDSTYSYFLTGRLQKMADSYNIDRIIQFKNLK